MAESSLLNGVPANMITLADRGLQFGDGVFETIKCDAHKLVYWQQHYARLQQGCDRLRITCPEQQLLLDDIARLLDESPGGVIKIIITRGASQRGYGYHARILANRIVTLSALPDYPQQYYQQGIVSTWCSHRLACNAGLAGLKTLNRLDNVLARAELDSRYQEGILLDQHDRVTEGTMSNLFIARDGSLYTPALQHAGIDGVIRNRLIAFADRAGLAVTVTTLSQHDIITADELFFCNSLIGLWPVAQHDATIYPSTDMARRLIQLLDEDETENCQALH